MPEMMTLNSTPTGRRSGELEANHFGVAKAAEDVRHVLQLVRRSWPIILFAILICLTVAVYYLSTRVPSHEATCRLLIIEQGVQPPSVVGGTAPGGGRDTRLDPVPTHIEIIRSPLVTRRAAQRLGIAEGPADGRRTRPSAAESIAGNLSIVQTDRLTRILRLTYRTPERDQAVRTLEAVTASYEDYLKQRYESKNKQLASLLNRAKDEIGADLEGLEARYLELRQGQIKSGLVVDREGRPLVSGRLGEWVRGVNQARQRSVQLESQLELGRELDREGFGRAAILRAMELMGGTSPADGSVGATGTEDAHHRLASELEDVELQRRMAQRLVARLEDEQLNRAGPVDPDEIEQALSEDPELAGLRAKLKAIKDKMDVARRVARNPADPSITMNLKRLSTLKEELGRLRTQKGSAIRQRLARAEAREDDSALRQARSELVALEVRRSTLREWLGAHRAEQARRLAGQRDRLTRQLGPEDPKVRELHEQIAVLVEGGAGARGDAERDKVRDLFRSLEQVRRANLTMHAKLEERLKGDLEEAKEAELKMLQETNLRNNLERQRALFNTVVDQLKQVRLVEDYASVSSEIVEPAHLAAPRSRAGLIIAGAVLLGTMLGLVAASLLEKLDSRIRTSDELRTILGYPMLGHVPLVPAAQGVDGVDAGLVCLVRPRSITSESFKSIRTHLESCRRNQGVRVILMTSPRPGDGKSTTASNLAIAIAQAGRSVLLVDADLRRPVQHSLHRLGHDHGLVHVLKGLLTLHHVAQPTAVERLSLVAAGPEIPDPAEALSSPQLAKFLEDAREEYDVVIIDSPPLLAVTDPCIISAVVDGVVLVVRPGSLRRHEASLVRELLKSLATPVLGTVVNGFTPAHASSGMGYGYVYGYAPNRHSSDGRAASEARSLGSAAEGATNGSSARFATAPVPVATVDSRTAEETFGEV